MNFQETLIAQLRQHSAQLAIQAADQQLSYQQLLEDALGIRQMILAQNPGQNNYVGVYMDDRVEIIKTMVGIMLAGKVFVPMDPEHPQTRTATVIQETGLTCVISSAQLSTRLSDYEQIELLSLDHAPSKSDQDLAELSKYGPEDSAYVYFTSGSTGKPKGIVGSYKGLLQFIQWETGAFELGSDDRFAQFTTPYFDAFLRDVFTPLFVGATICVTPKEEAFFAADKISAWMDQQAITTIHCVPSLFYTINQSELKADRFSTLRYIFMSGEKIAPAQLKKWYDVFSSRVQLVNFYGASESTMIRSYYQINPADISQVRIPVGKGIADTKLLVLDHKLQVKDTLAPGELYIVSNFITKGYLNNDQLTAERFITLELDGQTYRAYKTGDEARLLEDGNIDLLGRKDRQVKINGIRIELEEIDNVVLKSDLIKNVVTVEHKDQHGNQTLKSFVIKSDQAGVADVPARLNDHLIGALPSYMVPAEIKVVESFPLLSNGKIDIKKLQEEAPEEVVESQLSPLEQEVTDVWKKILGDKPFPKDKSFFLSGGNSLSFMNLIAALNKKYGLKLSLSQFFQNMTIEKQANLVQKNKKDDQVSVAAVSINKVEKAHYALTSAQKRLHFLHEFDRNSIAYNMPQFVMIEGALKLDRLKTAFQQLVDRHSIFRTSFQTVDGQVVQKVEPQLELDIRIVQGSEAELDQVLKGFVKPFDLSQAPLLRVEVVQLASDKYVLMTDVHHIISDGASTGLLVKDFISFYENKQLAPLKIEYKDYAEWQQAEEQVKSLAAQKAFWLKTFEVPSVTLALPADHPRPKFLKGLGGNYNFTLSEEQTRQLKSLAAQHDTTLFITVLSVFQIFLSKLSGQQDIVIGTSVDGRRHADLKQVIGMFANTLPMRAEVDPQMSFSKFLKTVKERTLKSFENQHFPFEDLVEQLNLERDTSRNPLFDIMFNYHSYERSELAIHQLKLAPVVNEEYIAKFDLTLNAHEIIGGEGIDLNFKYAAELFDADTIARFAAYFSALIDQVNQHSEQALAGLTLLKREELALRKEKLSTRIEQEVEPVQHKLNRSFSQYADQVAVEYQNRTYTYTDIQQEADKIANYILTQNLAPQSVIGVLSMDKQRTISAVLSLLQTRMVFVPIDIELPPHRISAMIDQVGCRHVLTDIDTDAFGQLFDASKVTRWSLHELLSASTEAKPREVVYEVNDYAYIYFTSGSTGQPKAIMGRNKGLSHFIDWELQTFPIDSHFKVSQFTSPSFDAYLRDTLVPLSAGATICIPDPEITGTEELTVDWIDQSGINLIHCVPSFFKTFSGQKDAAKLGSLRHVLLSGEPVLPYSLTDWYQTHGDRIQLTNLYGTTETTMVKAYGHIQPADTTKQRLSVREVTGAQLLVLDHNLEPCPPLVTGEIYIRTPFRTAGYIGNETENARVFVRNPHTDDQDDLLYRTGDLGREDLQGSIEVLGRNDAQIKLNGIRIELSDIKENLLKFPGMSDVVVAVKEIDGIKGIGAYYRAESALDEVEMGKFLSAHLPRTMLPAFFLKMEEFPLTTSGKTDVKALPVPEMASGDQTVPTTPEEVALIEVWQHVLNKEHIGIRDNFFTTGGDSLKAIRIVSLLKKAGYEIAIKDLFVYQNIEQLAPQLKRVDASEIRITPVAKRAYYPLSSGQRRQFMGHQMRDNTLNFNMTVPIEVGQTVDIGQVQRAIDQLIDRHESLRTSYKTVEGEPVQIVHDDIQVTVEEIGLETFNTPGYRFSEPFDLDQAPLVRVGFVRGEDDNLVLIDLHHINSDGISNNVLKEEFRTILRGESLPKPELQYKDFAVWQSEQNTPQNMEKMAAYWLDIFEQQISKTEWPKSEAAAYGQIDRANSITFEVDAEMTQSLKALATQNSVSLFNLLLSVQNIVFHKLTSLEDLVIGFPSAGRNKSELERVIGVFINTIALRVYPKRELSFKAFLSRVADHLNQALQYQDYPFDELIEQLNLPRTNNFNPLFNTIMVMQNHMDYDGANIVSDQEGIVRETSGEVAENELFIRCAEVQDRLLINYQYSTGVLLRQDMINIFGYFKEISQAILSNDEVKIGDIQLSHNLGEAEGELLEDAFSF